MSLRKPSRKSTIPEISPPSRTLDDSLHDSQRRTMSLRKPSRKSTVPEIPLGPGFPTLVPTYTPRVEAEDLLNKSAFPAEADPSTGKNVIVILGPPASGKTQLIVRFVQQNRNRFVATYFIESSSDRSVASGFKKYIQPLGIKDPQEALGYLERTQVSNKGPCLIVFNNHAPSVDLTAFLPRSDHFLVLITTQAQSFLTGVTPRAVFNLELMTSTEAEQFLSRQLGSSSGSKDSFKKVGDALGCNPAALSYAAAYMMESKISPDAYLLQLEPELTAEQARFGDLHAPMYAALNISYQTIPSSAQNLLLLLSYFSPSNFPLQFIRQAANTGFDYELYEAVQRSKEEVAAAVSLLKEIFYVKGNFDEGELRRNCDRLKMYNFISETRVDKLSLVSMHPEVKSWAQNRMDEPSKEQYQAAAIQLLSCSPRDQDPMDEYLVPQIMEFETTFDTLHTNDKASFAGVLERTGDHEQSLPLFNQVANELEQSCGLKHEDTLKAFTWLATVEQANKDYEAAAGHRKTVVDEMRRNFAAGDPRTIAAEASLAKSYASLHQYELARDLYKKVLETRKEKPNDPDTLTTSAELADVYQSLGRSDKALELRQDIFTRRKTVFGKDDPNTILAANNLGVTYYGIATTRKRALSSGEVEEAEAEAEEATRGLLVQARELQLHVLKYRRNAFGNRSPDTQDAMKNLMWTYYELNQTRDAEREAKTLCGVSTELRGPNDSLTLRAKLALALFQKDLPSAKEVQASIRKDNPDYQYATGIVLTIEASLEEPEVVEQDSCFKAFLKKICCCLF